MMLRRTGSAKAIKAESKSASSKLMAGQPFSFRELIISRNR
jgi:hypothetical protein